jgi:TRAP-type C4-dicarboxylate transport system substrate-binding protein
MARSNLRLNAMAGIAAIMTALLLSFAAAAEPITLKFSFFSSDRSLLYLSGPKPFIDAVNAEGRGRVRIEPYFSNRLGGPEQLSQLIRDGTADIGFVIPSYERTVFPDVDIIELPGLYQDTAEATQVFSQLVEAGALRGFGDFYVIGTFVGEAESIHARPPVVSLADLKGKRFRVNNEIEAEIIEKLGANSLLLPINRTTEAISSGQVDGALLSTLPMMEFGIGRVAPYHYLLGTSCIPLAILMNREKFDSLPGDVQAIIRKYSGAWLLDHYTRADGDATSQIMRKLESDPKRKVTFPSPADRQTADAVFKSIVDGYAAISPHNAELVSAARAAVAKLRGDSEVRQ